MYITAEDTEVTEKNVRDWVRQFNNELRTHYVELDTYYKGRDKLNKVQTELDKSTKRTINDIHVNYARMIVNNACGYFMGKPVSYEIKNKDFDKDVRELLWRNDEQAENMELAKTASRFGVAYELMALNNDKNVYIKSLSPLNTFFVVDNTILQEKICAITYWTRKTSDNKAKTIGYVYTKDEIRKFEGDDAYTFDEPETNPFKPCIPVFEFWNNDEHTGDYENVTEILSAYSKLISANFDDIDSIANAILAFINAELNKDDAKEFKKSRIVQILGENADVKYLEKHLDKEFVQYLREAIRDDIFSITHIPDLTDNSFSGVKSGEALSYKLIGFENLRLIKQNYFEKGLYQRLTCFMNYKKLEKAAVEIPEGDVTITFYANLPKNIDKDRQIAELFGKGVISRRTAIDKIEIVDDTDEEIKRIEDEMPDVGDINGLESLNDDEEENGKRKAE